MKRYIIKYLLSLLIFLSFIGSGIAQTPGTVCISVDPILNFDVTDPLIEFTYDEIKDLDGTDNTNDEYDRNIIQVQSNMNWELSVHATGPNLLAPGSSDVIPVSNIEVKKNTMQDGLGGITLNTETVIQLSTSPQIVLTGNGTIPTGFVRLKWTFMDMEALGNIRAGFYTVGVIYQLTSSDFPVASGPA